MKILDTRPPFQDKYAEHAECNYGLTAFICHQLVLFHHGSHLFHERERGVVHHVFKSPRADIRTYMTLRLINQRAQKWSRLLLWAVAVSGTE